MSALYPNVPDVPGVPVVNRADIPIQSAIDGAAQSRTVSQTGLNLIEAGDLSGAATTFTTSSGLAAAAQAFIDPVFAIGSIPTGALSSAAGMASGAANALARGDVGAAVSAGVDAVNYATDAILSMRSILQPSGIPILADSGPEVQADIAQQWGLYDQSGLPAVIVDNIQSLEVALEAQISDFPVENGGFASYNKVIRPFDVRLAMTKGGSVEDRQAFVQQVQDAWQSLDLFNVITPEVVYLDVNVVAVRRLVESDRGVGLMMLDVSLRKVRQTGRLAFTSTAQPASAGVSNNGAVQTQTDFRYDGVVD
jgi:hypothetical protein